MVEDTYSNVLELSKMVAQTWVNCQGKCSQTWGCVFYNYNKKLSACHFADPLGGSVTDKPRDLTGWSIYKIDKLSINGNDEF